VSLSKKFEENGRSQATRPVKPRALPQGFAAVKSPRMIVQDWIS